MTDIIETEEQGFETSQEAIEGLRNSEWYEALTEELKSSLVETEFDVRQTIIELYHNIGKVIVENNDKFEREKVYGKHIAEIIGNDINRHPSIVRRAMQFYNKFPDLKMFLSDKPKNFSWAKIRKEYLPNTERKISEKNLQETQIIPFQSEKISSIYSKILETDTYTNRDILDLFLSIKGAESSIDKKEITLAFIAILKNNYHDMDINNIIIEYSKGKTENECKFLEELKICINTSSDVDTVPQTNPSLFKDIPPIPLQNNRAEQEKKSIKHEFHELLSQYKQLYKNKFNREPVISAESRKKWLRQLITKKEQGFSLKDIISLLQIFAQSKDSNADRLGLILGTFFSDAIFNKMIAIKSKNSNEVEEGKYAKY